MTTEKQVKEKQDNDKMEDLLANYRTKSPVKVANNPIAEPPAKKPRKPRAKTTGKKQNAPLEKDNKHD